MKFWKNPVGAGLGIACAIAVSVLSPAVAAGLSADEIRYAKAALQAAESGDFNRGQAMATRDAALVKLIRWMELRKASSRAGFAEIIEFLAANPDWPGKHALRLRAEESMPADMSDKDVIAWFQKNPALGPGKLRLADAYARTGQKAKAEELIREAWTAGDFDVNQEKTFLLRYRDTIRAEEHWARLDRMLWDGRTGSPYQRMLTRVEPGQKALAEARLRLKSGAGGVERAINAVPANLQADPGFLYERAKWRRVRGQNDSARDILIKPPSRLVRPDLWWREVEYQARQALRDGDISLAYKLAASHKPGGDRIQADAEFFAGFVALRFLEDPKTGLAHFKRLHDGVTSPISKSRGAYWAGRAAEAMKDPAGAKAWYAKAAEHLTTFYGQIAAGKLSDTAPALPADAKPTSAEVQAFRRHELTRIVTLLHELGPNDLFHAFSIALVEKAKTPGERVLALNHIRSLGRTDTAVTVARRIARDGTVLIEDAYPIIALPKGDGPEAALVHAVIRQESGFDQRAVSRAKAQGLMQLIPPTAKLVSKELGLKYDLAELTQNPSYNITLGSSYLNGLIEDFDGSYIAAIAGYNAGPGRIKRWLRDNGDIRKREVDVLDWIEQIPIAETRNYVQRVLEALYIYRSRMSKTPAIDIAQALNRWCLYGCGGVIEANFAKARIGRAGADDACDAETDRTCAGDEDVVARDQTPVVEPVPVIEATPVSAPAAGQPVTPRPSAVRSGSPRTSGKD
jgi:soluble lytic murein transglycosylase